MTEPALHGAGTAAILTGLGIRLEIADLPDISGDVIFRDGSMSVQGLEILKSSDGTFLLNYEDGQRIMVDAARTCLRIGTGEDPEARELQHLLLDDAAPRLLSHMDQWTFHMGGILLGEKAIAIVGPSGTGKSTLIAALFQAGGQLLCDDALILDTEKTPPRVRILYPGLRLWPDSLSSLPSLQSFPTTEAGPDGKWAISVADREAPYADIQLGAIYFLQREEGRVDVQTERVSPGDGAFRLANSVLGLDLSDKGWARRLLTAVSAISSVVPIHRLLVPSDLGAIDQTVALLNTRHGPGA